MNDIYPENYKMFLREIYEDFNKWNCMPFNQRLNMVKMSFLPSFIRGFFELPIKIPVCIFVASDDLIFRNDMEMSPAQNNQSNPEEEKQRWRTRTPNYQTFL